MSNTKNYREQREKEKIALWKVFAWLFLFVLVFSAGVWVGDSYMPAIRQFFGRTARAPLEGVRSLVEGASSLASKEELMGAVDSNEELEPNEKADLKKDIARAYEVKEEYDGEYKPAVEQLWKDACRLYDRAREDGTISAEELREVVGKLKEAADAAK